MGSLPQKLCKIGSDWNWWSFVKIIPNHRFARRTYGRLLRNLDENGADAIESENDTEGDVEVGMQVMPSVFTSNPR